MKMDEILNTIRSLASSQGMYGRLYANLMDMKKNAPSRYAKVKEQLEAQNFGSGVDFVMWYEG